jgi:hypothetical protein
VRLVQSRFFAVGIAAAWFIACGDSANNSSTCGAGSVRAGGVCVPVGGGAGGAGFGGSAGRSGSGAGGAGRMGSEAGESSVGGNPGGFAGAGDAGNTSGAGGSSGDPSGGADDGSAGEDAGNAGANGGAAGPAGGFGGENGGAGGESGGAAGSDCVEGPVLCPSGAPLPTAGSLYVEGSAKLLALSDTTMLLANRVDKSLDVFDLCLGSVTTSWALPGTPVDFAFDAERRSVYVALETLAGIARVDLDAADVTLIELEQPALSVALGDRGRAFVRLEGRPGPVAVIDTIRNRVLEVVPGNFGEILAYDRRGDRLITLGQFGGVYAYEFLRATNEFVPKENPFDVSGGSNCDEAVISPDGRHLVLACPPGNRVTSEDLGSSLRITAPRI